MDNCTTYLIKKNDNIKIIQNYYNDAQNLNKDEDKDEDENKDEY